MIANGNQEQGKKRILIGSPKNMGTGVNVQKRLTHKIDLDAPWYPSDLEQPDGRILRQGNQNPTVWLEGLAADGTYDSTMYGMVARKAGFIEQAFRGDRSLRVMDDISAAGAYAMAAAIASGDPRYIQMAELESHVTQLETAKEVHQRRQSALRADMARFKHAIPYLREGVRKAEHVAERLAGTVFYSGYFDAVIDGQTLLKVKSGDLGDAVAQAVDREFLKARDQVSREARGDQRTGTAPTAGPTHTHKATHVIGTLAGGQAELVLTVEVEAWRTKIKDKLQDEVQFGLHTGARVQVRAAGRTSTQSVDHWQPQPDDRRGGIVGNAINRLLNEWQNKAVTQARAELNENQDALDKAERAFGAPFPQQAELVQAVTALATLRSDLLSEGKEVPEAEVKASVAPDDRLEPPAAEAQDAPAEAAKFSRRGDGEPSAEQLRKEHAATRARYYGTPEWRKAPNGKPSNLNEWQWVQVRTPRFKAWFGNWLYNAEAPVSVVKVSPPADMPATDNLADLRAWVKRRFQGSQVRNADTNQEIGIFGEGINASLKNRNPKARLAYAALPELLRTAVYVGYEANTKPEKAALGILGYETYAAVVDIEGARYPARIKVDLMKPDVRGSGYYYHQVDEIELGEPVVSPGDLANASAVLPGSPNPAYRLGQVVGESKPEFSKVLDANGEPRVVYHGWTTGRSGHDAGPDSFARGAFVSTSPAVASEYAGDWYYNLTEAQAALAAERYVKELGQRIEMGEFDSLEDARDDEFFDYVFTDAGGAADYAFARKTLEEVYGDLDRDDGRVGKFLTRYLGQDIYSEKAHVRSLFVSASRPIVIDANGNNFDSVTDPEDLAEAFEEAGIAVDIDAIRDVNMDVTSIVEFARDRYRGQYDAVVFNNIIDSGNTTSYFRDETATTIHVPDATQLKSATGNTGAYSSANDDIRYRRRAGAERSGATGAPRSADQSAARALNRALARQFQDDSWNNAYVQRDLPDALAEFAQAAEAAFGAPVIGITATERRFDQFNGVNVGGRNFINLAGPVGFVHVTGHELLHQLKRDRPDLYRWFHGQARAHYKNLPAYKAKLDGLLQPGETPFTRAAAEEELLGDFTGDALADPVFLEKLAKADPSRFRQLLNAVLKWLKQVGERLTGQGLGSSQYFTDVATLREHLAAALVAYGKGGPRAVGKIAGPKFHQAWHGSPHDFDQFSTGNIGTGDGRMAYGWGLYFSNMREIAEAYRSQTGRRRFSTSGGEVDAGGLIDLIMERVGNPSPGLAATIRSQVGRAVIDMAENGRSADDVVRSIQNSPLASIYSGIARAIGQLDPQLIKGHIYQVELAPRKDEYLDWHQPLSEQSETVRKAIQDIPLPYTIAVDDQARTLALQRDGKVIETESWPNRAAKTTLLRELRARIDRLNDLSGEVLYKRLAANEGGPQNASQYLHSLGVRGIRYPAEGQSGGKTGDRFNYVIFDDRDVEITAKFSRKARNIAVMADGATPQQATAGDGAVAAPFSAPRTPWGDFKDVYIHADEIAVKQHPRYHAAKTGDGRAAAQLVNAFLDPRLIKQVMALIGTAKPMVVSVHAMERGGINAIPEALADALSVRLDLPVDDSLIQTNVVSHTSADGFSRIARQALFDGEVAAGQNYLIVDDFVGQGGTIANLRGYIESKGGRVIGAVVLTGRPYSATLKLSAAQLNALREKHGPLEPWWRQRFGFGFDALTESEARYLQRTPDADRIRDRVTAAQQAATGAADQAAHQEIGSTLRRNAGDHAGEDFSPRFSRRADLNTSPNERKPDAGAESRVAAGAAQALARVDAALASGGGWKGALQRLNGQGEESFRKLSATARRQILGALTVHQLVDVGESVLPRMREYLGEMSRMDATRNRLIHESDQLAQQWAALPKAENARVGYVMHEATLAGVDGAAGDYQPSIDVEAARARMKALQQLQLGAGGSNKISQWQEEWRDLKAQVAFEQKREKEWARVQALYDALTPAGQAVYTQVRDYHAAHLDRVEQALVAMIEKTRMTGQQKYAAIQELKQEFETMRVQAPYFPLGRFGDYWVNVAEVTNDAGKVVKEREFEKFETYESAEAFYHEKQAEGRQVSRGKQIENLREVSGVSTTFVAQVEDLIGELGADLPEVADLRDQVYQLYLRTLPEVSARKQAIHRGNSAFPTAPRPNMHCSIFSVRTWQRRSVTILVARHPGYPNSRPRSPGREEPPDRGRPVRESPEPHHSPPADLTIRCVYDILHIAREAT